MPPHILVCGSCGAGLKTSFNHRATWMSWIVWEWSWLLITILFTALVLTKGYPAGQAIAISAVGSVLFGLMGGYIISLVIPVPIQAGLDLVRLVWVKWVVVKKDDGEEEEEEPPVIEENLSRPR